MLAVVANTDSFDIIDVSDINEVYTLIQKGYLYTAMPTVQSIAKLLLSNPKLIINNIMLMEKSEICIKVSGDSFESVNELLKLQPDIFYILADVNKSVCGKYTLYLFPFELHSAIPNKSPAAIRSFMINEMLKDIC